MNPNLECTLVSISWRMNEVCKLLDILYDVNCGGCCYIAYCLSKLLSKDGIDYDVIVISDDCYELNNCETLNDISCSCSHYGISIGGHLINIDNKDLEYEYVKYFNNVHPDDIKEHYENEDWNNCYNTDKNDFIWEMLKNFYYDITQNLREC